MDGHGVPRAWIELETDEAVEASMPAGKERTYDFGYVSSMLKLIRAHPRLAQAFRPLIQAVMIAPGRLSRREREMIAAVAAAAQDCTY